MSQQHKKLIIQALIAQKGDELERATQAFKNLTPTEMNQTYYFSGKTPVELLKELTDRNQRYNDAIEWVRALPD